jgi:hypothetical protein
LQLGAGVDLNEASLSRRTGYRHRTTDFLQLFFQRNSQALTQMWSKLPSLTQASCLLPALGNSPEGGFQAHCSTKAIHVRLTRYTPRTTDCLASLRLLPHLLAEDSFAWNRHASGLLCGLGSSVSCRIPAYAHPPEKPRLRAKLAASEHPDTTPGAVEAQVTFLRVHRLTALCASRA